MAKQATNNTYMQQLAEFKALEQYNSDKIGQYEGLLLSEAGKYTPERLGVDVAQQREAQDPTGLTSAGALMGGYISPYYAMPKGILASGMALDNEFGRQKNAMSGFVNLDDTLEADDKYADQVYNEYNEKLEDAASNYNPRKLGAGRDAYNSTASAVKGYMNDRRRMQYSQNLEQFNAVIAKETERNEKKLILQDDIDKVRERMLYEYEKQGGIGKGSKNLKGIKLYQAADYVDRNEFTSAILKDLKADGAKIEGSGFSFAQIDGQFKMLDVRGQAVEGVSSEKIRAAMQTAIRADFKLQRRLQWEADMDTYKLDDTELQSYVEKSMAEMTEGKSKIETLLETANGTEKEQYEQLLNNVNVRIGQLEGATTREQQRTLLMGEVIQSKSEEIVDLGNRGAWKKTEKSRKLSVHRLPTDWASAGAALNKALNPELPSKIVPGHQRTIKRKYNTLEEYKKNYEQARSGDAATFFKGLGGAGFVKGEEKRETNTPTTSVAFGSSTTTYDVKDKNGTVLYTVSNTNGIETYRATEQGKKYVREKQGEMSFESYYKNDPFIGHYIASRNRLQSEYENRDVIDKIADASAYSRWHPFGASQPNLEGLAFGEAVKLSETPITTTATLIGASSKQDEIFESLFNPNTVYKNERGEDVTIGDTKFNIERKTTEFSLNGEEYLINYIDTIDNKRKQITLPDYYNLTGGEGITKIERWNRNSGEPTIEFNTQLGSGTFIKVEGVRQTIIQDGYSSADPLIYITFPNKRREQTTMANYKALINSQRNDNYNDATRSQNNSPYGNKKYITTEIMRLGGINEASQIEEE
jgi:hypothetical protein